MPILFFIRSWSFSNNPVPKPELGNERFFFIELKCYIISTFYSLQSTIYNRQYTDCRLQTNVIKLSSRQQKVPL
ncbi:hypothetical protein KsCSTR_33510 [Candidatus Kuenenia stuttgartiensis]|uniref:Uncharacterized protein n=1 Tax=Kuenenia stuttgartiensis TaxID=174633 RepID=Q1Q4E7_KUEST|nr:hypothetical protein KsCSTR_33510 [Candidatus Kuenenia stuttgartiensis]CAJ74886.1 unknown protein [Candidatus Kuenenia stuttgartiensis]